MAKHTITVKMNGVEYTITTDAPSIKVGDFSFEFQDGVTKMSVDPVATPKLSAKSCEARFNQVDSLVNKIPCIKAVRAATGWDLEDCKTYIENSLSFPIRNDRYDRFIEECRKYHLNPSIME